MFTGEEGYYFPGKYGISFPGEANVKASWERQCSGGLLQCVGDHFYFGAFTLRSSFQCLMISFLTHLVIIRVHRVRRLVIANRPFIRLARLLWSNGLKNKLNPSRSSKHMIGGTRLGGNVRTSKFLSKYFLMNTHHPPLLIRQGCLTVLNGPHKTWYVLDALIHTRTHTHKHYKATCMFTLTQTGCWTICV